jgi:hypothetical protein
MTLSAQQDFCFLKVCDRRVVFFDVVIGIGAIKKESKLAGFVWVGFDIPLDRFFILVRMVKGEDWRSAISGAEGWESSCDGYSSGGCVVGESGN